MFIAEGPKIIHELLNEYPAGIRHIYATRDWINDQQVPGNIELTEVDSAGLERISQLKTPNKVVAIVRQFPEKSAIQVRNHFTLVLDAIQDPGNFGSIIRSADWFGITQVVCNHECADIYNPKVVQATMGSIARVRVMYTNIEDWLQKNKDVRIYGTGLQGKTVNEIGILKEGILVIGNESKGIDEKVLELVDEVITIPKKGKAESLNAAVATGIILAFVCLRE